MLRFQKQLLKDERGQVLPLVLCLLAIGGLTIAVNLNYATTTLKGNGIVAEDVRGDYAASAGVEQTLWSLETGNSTANATPENINQMAVTIQTASSGPYTLYLDTLVTPGGNSGYIHVSSSMVPAGGTTDNYTITVTTDPNGYNQKKLSEIGALLPPGYTYVANSAAGFPANVSTNNPTTGYEATGCQWLKWPLGGYSITKGATYTQKFRITGAGSTAASYAWVIGQSSDIGTVGQITGTLATITATAKRQQDGKTAAKVVANAIVGGGGTYVFSWKISKQ